MQPTTPRRLTTHQKAVLIQVLLTFPDQQVGIIYSPAASDALDYAQDFLAVFNAIGWEIKDGAPQATLNGQTAGLVLMVGERNGLPPGGEALRDALCIYQIEVTTLADPGCSMPSGGFVLAIGRQE